MSNVRMILIFILLVSSNYVLADLSIYKKLDISELEKEVENLTPAGIFILSDKLLDKKDSVDKGVFWFHVGHIRGGLQNITKTATNADENNKAYNMVFLKMQSRAICSPEKWIISIENAIKWERKNQIKQNNSKNHMNALDRVTIGLEDVVARMKNNKENLILKREKMQLKCE